jgi:hypothetical protein
MATDNTSTLARLWSARIAAAERPPPFALRGGGRGPGLGRAPPPNERLGRDGENDALQPSLARWWARDAAARAFAARFCGSSTSAPLPAGALAWARGGAYLEAGRAEQAHRDGRAALALAQAAAAAASGGGKEPNTLMMMLAMAHALCGSALEALAERPAPAGQEEEDDDDDESSDDEGGGGPRQPKTLRARLCLSRAALHAAEAAEFSGGLLPGPSAALLARLPASHRQALVGDEEDEGGVARLPDSGPATAPTTGAAARLRARLAADARARLPLIMRPPPPGAPDGGRYRFFRALAFKRLAALFPAATAATGGGDPTTATDVDDEPSLLARVALPACVARRMVEGADAGDLDLMLQHPALAAAQAAELLMVAAAAAADGGGSDGGGGGGDEAAVAAHPIAPLSWREVQIVEGAKAAGLSLGHEVGVEAALREARLLRRAIKEEGEGGGLVAASSAPRALAADAAGASSLAPAPMALVRLFSGAEAVGGLRSRADLLLALMERFEGR